MLFLVLALVSACHRPEPRKSRPNILFVLADDQSFPYASAYGTPGVHTPAFDEVAHRGMLFYNAFAAAPQCSPSRARHTASPSGRNRTRQVR